MNFSFPTEEKLKSRKTIEALFSGGKSLSQFPIKVFFTRQKEGTVSKAAFAVPKRNFKHAVTRNRIKRQMRASYRLHKHMLTANNSSKFALLFLYIGKEMPEYDQLKLAVCALLKKID